MSRALRCTGTSRLGGDFEAAAELVLPDVPSADRHKRLALALRSAAASLRLWQSGNVATCRAFLRAAVGGYTEDSRKGSTPLPSEPGAQLSDKSGWRCGPQPQPWRASFKAAMLTTSWPCGKIRGFDDLQPVQPERDGRLPTDQAACGPGKRASPNSLGLCIWLVTVLGATLRKECTGFGPQLSKGMRPRNPAWAPLMTKVKAFLRTLQKR